MGTTTTITTTSTESPANTRQQQMAVVCNKLRPFLFGGLAGCVATTCIQPIDMVKVRIQLMVGNGDIAVPNSKNPFVVARNIIQREGFLALYKGLDAGLTRQVTYTTARLGIFRLLCDTLQQQEQRRQQLLQTNRDLLQQGSKDSCNLSLATHAPAVPASAQPLSSSPPPLPLAQKAVAGLVAGGVAAVLGNPADLALVRLQADTALPQIQRRGYTGVGNTVMRIVREEGIFALWRGATPTVLRAMSLNMGMLAGYDQSKEILSTYCGLQPSAAAVGASGFSGFFAATLSLPFDFLKTRIQKAAAGSLGSGRMETIPETLAAGTPFGREGVVGSSGAARTAAAATEVGTTGRGGLLRTAIHIARTEGLCAFYTAYPTYYVRIAPHAMITLLVLDFLNSLFGSTNSSTKR